MSTPDQRVSQKAGLSPGALVYIGPKKAEEARVTLIQFTPESYEEKVIEKVNDLPVVDQSSVMWVNVEGIHQVDIIEKIGDRFALHPLVLEDILNTKQRSKMEEYNEYVYLVLKSLAYEGKYNRIVANQVSLILGTNFVLTFQESKGSVFDSVKERTRSGKGRIRRMGADYLAYALVDAIVDEYFRISEHLGENIEFLEEQLITGTLPTTLSGIRDLRRQLMFFRRSVWPLREMISGLERGESSFFTKSTVIYLKDVYDHIIEIMDTVENYREMISEMLDTYMSSVSYRVNEVMKVLTIIATIFIPLTFVVGVYGMNFKYMPELSWRWGYPAVWLIMIVITISMLAYFRKKRWL